MSSRSFMFVMSASSLSHELNAEQDRGVEKCNICGVPEAMVSMNIICACKGVMSMEL